MTTAQETLATKLERVAKLKAKLDKLAPLKAELDELKTEILADMQSVGSKRTESFSGYFAVRAIRQTVSVVDSQAVKVWLEMNEFYVDDYMKLDETRVKALADEKLHATGEIVPGIAVDETEYITLRSEK